MPVSGEIKLADANVWLVLAFLDHLDQLVSFDQGFNRFCGLDCLVLT